MQGTLNLGPVPAGGGPGGGNGGPGGGGGEAGNPDTLAPAFASLATSPKTFRAAAKGGSVLAKAKKAKVGTRVRYSLSEAAIVTFTIERSKAGRRVTGKCTKRTRANRKRKKCDLRLKGSFKHSGRAGRNSFRFSGRLRGRKLAPGRYNLVATARDAAGNGSKSKRTRFRVVK